VIQTVDNKMPLVAGKKTVVRVFLKARGDPSGVASNIRAALFIWPEGKTEVEVQPYNGPVNLVNDAQPNRSDTDASINFAIPPELTAAGVFSLRAVVNPSHNPEESNFDNNELTQPFEFVERNPLKVGFVRIGYKPPGQTVWAWPGDGIAAYDGMLRKLYPIADNGLQYYELPFRIRTNRPLSTDDLGEDLNWQLREFYNRIEGDKPDIMVGWLPNEYAGTVNFGGLAETVLSGQVARVALAVDFHSDYSSLHVLPHEVGHDLGLEHTGTKSDSSGDCRLSLNTHPGYWPSEYGDSAAIQDVGFDTQQMKVIPGTNYDLMSYCTEKKTWLSTFHYKKLFDYNLQPQGAYTRSRVDMILMSGWASTKGDAATIEFVKLPASGSGGSTSPQSVSDYSPRFASSLTSPLTVAGTGLSAGAMQTEGTGNHCLRLLDTGGALRYERCFDLTFQSEETGEPLTRSGFVFEVPDPGNVAKATLVRNDSGQGQELTSVEVSANAPTLTITSPKAGDTWAGEHTITWTGSDQDGDDLRYDILYSADGKQTWYPLEVGSHDTQYTFSTDEILPGDQTYIRVLASDGFNTTSADVGPLVVPQQSHSPGVGGTSGSGGANTTTGGATSQGGGSPGLSYPVIIGGALGLAILVMVVLALSRSSRRRAPAYTAGAATPPLYTQQTPPTQAHAPAAPYYQPAQPPAPAAVYPVAPNPFQAAQLSYGQWQAALAGGRVTRQQYEAAVNAIRVQDRYGRYWMLGAYDGMWYVYDGRSWVRANPS
jgi:hypothetical protein